jgi:hypothetical protein
MVEGLSRSIKAAIDDGSLKGLPLHGLHPPILHSQFVDDTMMMGTPMAREAAASSTLSMIFSEAFGTSINTDKSQIFFFNTPHVAIQAFITHILGVQ